MHNKVNVVRAAVVLPCASKRKNKKRHTTRVSRTYEVEAEERECGGAEQGEYAVEGDEEGVEEGGYGRIHEQVEHYMYHPRH